MCAAEEVPKARCVLVTGASGMVGGQVVAQLARSAASTPVVVALDLHPPPERLIVPVGRVNVLLGIGGNGKGFERR